MWTRCEIRGIVRFLASQGGRSWLQSAASGADDPELIRALFNRFGEEIYSELSENKETPVEILAKIVDASLIKVNWLWFDGLLNNPKLPADLLEKLYWGFLPDWRETMGSYFAKHPNTPRHVLLDLAVATRCGKVIAEIVDSHPALFEEVAAIVNERIRRDIVIFDFDDCKYLLGCGVLDKESVVRLYRLLSSETENRVRYGRERLWFSKENAAVRRLFAANAFTPPEALSRLAFDNDLGTRACALENPSLPIETIRRAAVVGLRYNHYGVLEHISLNPNCPVDVLVMLSMSPHEPVSRNARERLATKLRGLVES
ncbi:MAG: hypothetical protein AB1330_01535 [Bacillota bacterium]